jgi:transposase InsO family protein
MLCDELNPQGFSCPQIARQLRVLPRTLSHWRCRRQRNELDARLRGRPPKQSAFCDRHEVLEVFQDVGPHVGLPTLRAAFPTIPRGELIALQADYRGHYRATHRRSIEELHWTLPGRVWAMDHTQPPSPIDGCYERVLAVRDLASGMQIAWLPVADETAETTARVLRMLFARHGAPLLLKSDNGSPFISHLLQELLAACQVVPLFSPPQMPEYNGACEACIGAMKDRTESLAARAGRIVHWTSDDLEAARRQANEFHRPWGHRGPTRSEVWTAREPITDDERAAFAVELACCQQRVRDSLAGNLAGGNTPESASSARGNHPEPGAANPPTIRSAAEPTEAAPLAHGNSTQPASLANGSAHHRGALAHGNSQTVDACVQEEEANRNAVHSGSSALRAVPGASVHGASEEALIHRRAVRQALVGLGLLSITRRSIPLPI